MVLHIYTFFQVVVGQCCSEDVVNLCSPPRGRILSVCLKHQSIGPTHCVSRSAARSKPMSRVCRPNYQKNVVWPSVWLPLGAVLRPTSLTRKSACLQLCSAGRTRLTGHGKGVQSVKTWGRQMSSQIVRPKPATQ